jgi:hypothetical protein
MLVSKSRKNVLKVFFLEFCLKQIIANNELVESREPSTESSHARPWWET